MRFLPASILLLTMLGSSHHAFRSAVDSVTIELQYQDWWSFSWLECDRETAWFAEWRRVSTGENLVRSELCTFDVGSVLDSASAWVRFRPEQLIPQDLEGARPPADVDSVLVTRDWVTFSTDTYDAGTYVRLRCVDSIPRPQPIIATRRIVGRIVNDSTDEPIDDAMVRIPGTFLRAVSRRGRFVIEAVPVDRTVLTACALAYRTIERTLALGDTVIHIRLEPQNRVTRRR